VPDVLVLMCTGLLLGPTLHWIDASKFESATRGFGTLALIIIIFEAGLELNLRETLKQLPAGLLLAVTSFAFSMAAAATVCAFALDISRQDALLAGATVACVSSSIMLPVLQQVELRAPTRITLVVESSISDALGVLTVGTLLAWFAAKAAERGSVPQPLTQAESVIAASSVVGGLMGSIILRIAISVALALVAGFLWSRLLPFLSDQRFWQVLTFGAVLILYALTEKLRGSDLFAVMIFGMVLANTHGRAVSFKIMKIAAHTGPQTQEGILSFHAELGFLVRTFFFVLIGATLKFAALRQVALLSLAVLAALFLARGLAVQFSRLAWRGTTRHERELATLMIPRGLVTAVLALEIADRLGPESAFLVSLAFALILFSNLLLLVGTVRSRILGNVILLGEEMSKGMAEQSPSSVAIQNTAAPTAIAVSAGNEKVNQ
jgi:potassium/hydrogen antiporter